MNFLFTKFFFSGLGIEFFFFKIVFGGGLRSPFEASGFKCLQGKKEKKKVILWMEKE